jgi:L,D-peptidoglycan transpeptidase YkuD (ErfK/YbiS/YcfS/YnhG family)
MSVGRFLTACTASLAVAATAFLALDIREQSGSSAGRGSEHGYGRVAARNASAAATTAQQLPIRKRTYNATQVITVVAHSRTSTVATLQAWRKVSAGGWIKRGPAIRAHIGSEGMTRTPSEWKSASPIGSFTLTRTFGYRADPGTAMPYVRTRPSDWWISEAGSLYNTRQRCATNCSFTQGDPNEHLYYVRPQYAYFALIDYNTRNSSTGVRQGAGSAFFLHVTDGSATAGCVAIAQDQLVSILRWLRPGRHPRILLGVA